MIAKNGAAATSAHGHTWPGAPMIETDDAAAPFFRADDRARRVTYRPRLTPQATVRKMTELLKSEVCLDRRFYLPTSGRGSATKPSRFGILTFGRLLASITLSSGTMPLRFRMYATTAYTSGGFSRPGSSNGIARLT